MASSLNRRAMLGAVAAAPTLLIASGSVAEQTPSAESDLFSSRFAAFESANAAFLKTFKIPSLTDEIGNQACLSAGDAYDVMIATPAPDFHSLCKKLDALSRWSSGSEIPSEEIAMLAADARRLLGREG